MTAVRLRLSSLPVPDRWGDYPIANPVASFTYRCPTHSIHLYGYDGTLFIDGKAFPFKAGDMTCASANAELAFESTNPDRHWVIHFYDPLPPRTPKAEVVEIPTHVTLGKARLPMLEQMRTICALLNAAGETDGGHSPLRAEASLRLS